VLLGNGWPLNNAKAMFPMGSGPRLYTESHVAAECYRISEQFLVLDHEETKA
jgi:hypothetical protein